MIQAQKCGLQTPEFHSSTDFDYLQNLFYENQKKYSSLRSIEGILDFRSIQSVKKEDLGLIEHIEGKLFIIYYVDYEVFAITKDTGGSRKVDITYTEQESCRKLVESLRIRIGQLIFIEHKTRGKILLNVSSNPNWLHAPLELQEKMFAYLYSILSNSIERHIPLSYS